MYIIYKLYAKSDVTETPKYIGITANSLNKRLKMHLERAKYKYGSLNWPVINWLYGCIQRQEEVIIQPIDFAKTREEAFSKEVSYIKKFTDEGIILKNATLGGEGNNTVRIKQFNINGELIKDWPSISSVEKELGLSNSHISSCCKNRSGRKTVGGYVWRYEQDTFDSFGEIFKPKNTEKIGRLKRRPIYQIDLKGNIIKLWEHSQQIEDNLGICRTNISNTCKNLFTVHQQRPIRLRKASGFYWCYESDKDMIRSLLKGKSIEQIDNCNTIYTKSEETS